MTTARRPLILAACLVGAALPARAEEVTLFAAASLKTAMDEIAPGFEAQTGHELTISYAGSSALARQIEQGAPADVFISANVGWMDVLEEAGRIDAATRHDLLHNTLVLVGPVGAEPAPLDEGLDLAGRLGGGFLAMALTEAVPAGIYGKAALTALGLWDGVAGQVAQADNVRAALALVAAGEAPLGIVYATDAAAEPAVSVVGTFPEGSHPEITYPAAAVMGAGDGAAALLDYLSGEAARAVFTGQGFAMAR